MDVLNSTGMADALREYIQRDRPFLGICLGLQLLFDSSEENGPGNVLSRSITTSSARMNSS
jgi:glutamine amidotransferase/cyclase